MERDKKWWRIFDALAPYMVSQTECENATDDVFAALSVGRKKRHGKDKENTA